MIENISIVTVGQGLFEFTDKVDAVVHASGVQEGLCTLFVRHTSASLLVQENADPSAKRDLETWLKRLAPEDERLYTHNDEGADDMPAHIKAMLTPVSLGIPIREGKLVLGIWQGIYLFEHRRRGGAREVVVHILS
jgi:secondary thiamine-phosphate synthase enzyme